MGILWRFRKIFEGCLWVAKSGMELVCEKYKEKMPEDEACCRHPKEYCKFRSACMIQFVAKENSGCREEEKSDPDTAD